MKKYVLIAGVNGAGKSTLYQLLDSISDLPRINTDEIVREFGDWKNISDVTKAGKIAARKIKELFANESSFNQETTLCGNSIIRNIKLAKEKGVNTCLDTSGNPFTVEEPFFGKFNELM